MKTNEMNTNQTPTASASPWRVELLGHTLRVVDVMGNDVALVGDVGFPMVAKRAKQICDEHNAIAGMEPGSVAALVAAAESLLESIGRATSSCPREIDPESKLGIKAQELRAALAALKGGAK